jgi:hypothetical protein
MVTHVFFYISIFIIFFAGSLPAQQTMRGKVYDKNRDKVLAAATIRNITRKVFRESDFGGNYLVNAEQGDTVIFTSVSYLADTITVTAFMLDNPYDISLQPSAEMLESVTVGHYNNYQLDSITRREEYKKVYDKKNAKLVGGSTPGGVGITFSPITYFSKNEKKHRQTIAELQNDEEQYYIDYRFASTYVNRLTKLQGDSLRTFMLHYRPKYNVARKSSQQDMLFYINDRLIEFKNGEMKKRK